MVPSGTQDVYNSNFKLKLTHCKRTGDCGPAIQEVRVGDTDICRYINIHT